MFSHIKKITALYIAVIFFVVFDRLLKAAALAGIESDLLGEFLKFNFKANYYIAFSLPFYGAWLNGLIILILLSLIYCLARAFKEKRKTMAVCLFAIVLGAAGNLFDRLSYGYVIDYFDLKYFTVFNLADVMIVIGTLSLLLIINNYKHEKF